MSLIREDIIKKMRDRGYEEVSVIQSGGEVASINFVKRLSQPNLGIHANVQLKRESVTLSFVELAYFCQLSMPDISFDHPDFAKYEQILSTYAAKCLDIQPIEILNNWKETGVKKTLETRLDEFKKKVITIGKEKGYTPDVCKAFFNYWSETNDDGRKMRWEIAKSKGGVFNIERRLITWLGKDKEFNAKFADRDEKKAQKQNEEIKTIKKVDTKKLF